MRAQASPVRVCGRGVSWSCEAQEAVDEEKKGEMLVEMTPGGVSHGGVLEEQRFERQIGCMAGFLHLFDRGHIGRRGGFSARRLTAGSIAESSSPSTRSDSSSPSLFKESQPPPPSSPEVYPSSPESRTGTPARRLLPLPLQVFDTSEGGKTSWRIHDGPRLSLDSRAVLDVKGKLHPRQIRAATPVNTGVQSDASEAGEEQRRSPSVVARLMGLEGLSSHNREGGAEPDGAKLQRSASESRVRKDLSCYGFVDVSSMHHAHPGPPGSEPISAEEFFKSVSLAKFKLSNTTKAMPPSKNGQLPPRQRKIFFDAEDIFPEPKRPGTLYGEIEKRLRMRGIDEPAKDMETVKQILEALQLKGLLHSKPSHLVGGRRNLYSNQYLIYEGAPIVIKSTTKTLPGRTGESHLLPLKIGAAPQFQSLAHCERSPVDRLFRGSDRRNRALKSPESPSSPVNRRPQNAVAHRSSQRQRRTSPVVSPKSSPKRLGLDFPAARSPRIRRPTDSSFENRVYSPAEDDTSPTFSENSAVVSSQYDFVSSKAGEYIPGRNLLERCDKLLHSIVAFTGAAVQSTASDLQPSPVSVLDSLAFIGEEGSLSPSPLSKRFIDFKDLLMDDREESQWSSTESTIEGDANGGLGNGDPDYHYVCEVVRACDRYGDACAAVYAVLEKRRAVDSCKADRLHRRLLFDTVAEILDRTRRVSPWDAFSRAISSPPAPGEEEVPPRQVWTDIRSLRELASRGEESGMDDAAVAVGGAVRKDIDGRVSDGWSRPGPDLSDAVLYIERLVFKDLVAEAIRDLAAANATARRLVPRRKLEF